MGQQESHLKPKVVEDLTRMTDFTDKELQGWYQEFQKVGDEVSDNDVASFQIGGMGFISRADQISHTLPTTRHRCNLDVCALAQSCGDGHRSIVTPERVLSEYNEDLICTQK